MKYKRFGDIPQFTRNGDYSVDMPLDSLVRWLISEEKEMKLQLTPDFQRGHVWTEYQQISFIEYILKGGKSGRYLYFNCPSWYNQVKEGSYDDYVCVDGLQRITAIQRFVNNEIPAFGNIRTNYEDRFDMLNGMHINVNNLKTKQEVLQWYVDMNSGGTPHTEQEIEKVKQMMIGL